MEAPGPANNDQGGTSTDFQQSARDRIQARVEEAIRANPSVGIVYADILDSFGSDQDITTQKVSGALRRMEEQGLLIEYKREKIPDRPEAKDRKVIFYRATDALKVTLGLQEQDRTLSETEAPPAELLKKIHSNCQNSGFICRLDDVVNFFLCLQAKPFVVLSGISGTGKTQLPRVFAASIGASHALVPVKPNWTDNSDLMGYANITGDFVPGRMLAIIRSAIASPERPHFAVLDEMNLAHVEHYLSDLLSVMETRRRNEAGIPTTDPLPLDLPGAPIGEDADDATGEWASLRSLSLPWNLMIVGTVNVDETTHPFSRKVLDRSFAIDFNDVDLTRFTGQGAPVVAVPGSARFLLDRPLSITEVYNHDAAFFDEIAIALEIINQHLRTSGLHFAYRVRDEIALYMWAWRRHALESVLSRDDAFDLCLLQKVLPRCQGSAEAARRSLEGVFRYCSVVVPQKATTAEGTQGAGQPATAGGLGGARSTGEPVSAPLAQPEDAAGPPVGQVTNAPIDVTQAIAPPPGMRWRHPRTAQKALAMLRRYADTGYFAFWS
jgi:hypothetical protein